MSDPADKNPYGGSLGGDLPEHYTYNPETLNKKRSPFWEKVDIHNRILYIIFLVLVWYILICGTLEEILMGNFSPYPYILDGVSDEATRNALSFIMEMYLTTLVSFIVVFLYTGISKRNRFIFKSFLPGHARNRISKLLNGLLVGFIMNFGCILCALLNGDIKLFYNFTLNQIPLFLFALVCVFIQSSSEELWCRGFMYERINVRYPLWVAILINGVFFGALHTMNPGVSALPITGSPSPLLSGTPAASGSLWGSTPHGTSHRTSSSGFRTAVLYPRHPSLDSTQQAPRILWYITSLSA